MPQYLALDTCTEICSVGLWVDGVVTRRVSDTPREHTRRLLPMVEELLSAPGLAPGDLNGLFCTRGPGSFTGVRIGISVAQGLSFAQNIPVWPLSTLAVLALQGAREDCSQNLWHVAMDARMNEVYHALYRVKSDAYPELIEPEGVSPVAEVARSARHGTASAGRVGSGWQLVEPADIARTSETTLPAPESVLECGLRAVRAGVNPVTAMALQPVYLRDQVTHSRS